MQPVSARVIFSVFQYRLQRRFRRFEIFGVASVPSWASHSVLQCSVGVLPVPGAVFSAASSSWHSIFVPDVIFSYGDFA